MPSPTPSTPLYRAGSMYRPGRAVTAVAQRNAGSTDISAVFRTTLPYLVVSVPTNSTDLNPATWYLTTLQCATPRVNSLSVNFVV